LVDVALVVLECCEQYWYAGVGQRKWLFEQQVPGLMLCCVKMMVSLRAVPLELGLEPGLELELELELGLALELEMKLKQ
jgi:hypothetical protein